MSDLTADDIAVLIEALEAWKSKDGVTELIDELIVMFGPQEDSRIFGRQQFRAAAKRNRNERAITLQAKLLEMRARIEAET